jgi:SagB-type dehydrogenase family enzyme
VANFSLEQLAQGNFLDTLTSAALGQSSVKKAAIVFIWTAVILRSMAKYRDRAIRYIFLDAGHICQNLLLAATALGLGACPIGAFFDEEIDKIIGVNGDEEMTIYLATVGKI